MQRLFIFFILSTFTLGTLSALDDRSSGIEQHDSEALRGWVKTKQHQVNGKERGGKLTMSGEVRTELKCTDEKKDGKEQLGSGGVVPNPATNAWNVEANLLLDYLTDATWATMKLKFDNNAGTETKTSDKISLSRAFLGGRIINADTYTLDLEIGRRLLDYTFDSKVQFGSMMDGLMLKYDQAFEDIGDFYFHGGPFLVNDNLDHYAYVGELGLLDIGRLGIYTKLSAIDWDTKHTDSQARNDAFRFLNVQWTLGYKLVPTFLDKNVTVYGAGLLNTLAKGTVVTNGSKEPWAWYLGFSIGELHKQNDWSLDVNYQWVQAQAIPDFDGNGISRGNAAKVGLYSERTMGRGAPLGKGEGVGAGNYKGFAAKLLYLLTDNITIYQEWRQSVNQNCSIHPTSSYKQYEFEVIYGF